jgi:hypothetical protein
VFIDIDIGIGIDIVIVLCNDKTASFLQHELKDICTGK